MPLSPTLVADDGDFSAEIEIAPLSTERPFGNTPQADIYAQVHERMFEIAFADFVPRIKNRSSRQNTLLWSEAFENAAWTKVGGAITANQYANPIDGALTADLFTESGGVTLHGFTAAGTASSGFLGNRLAIFVKPLGGHENIWLEFVDSAAASDSAMFDLTAGVCMPNGTDGSTIPNGTITRLPDGWFRLSIGFVSAAGAGTMKLYTGSGGVKSVADLGATFAFYGANLSSTFTSSVYVPTTTAARTVSVPEIDGLYNPNSPGADLFAFLVAESKPQAIEGGLWQFTRTYARIPADQVRPGSMLLSRPSLHNVFITAPSSAWGVVFPEKPDRSYVFTSRKSVSSLAALTASGSTTVNSAAALDHTLITVEGNNSVRTFYADDSDATIQTAMSNAILGNTSYASSVYFPILRNPGRITIHASVAGGSILKALSSPSLTAPVSLEGSQALGVAWTVGALFSVGTQGNSSTTTDTIDPSIRTVAATAHGGAVGSYAVLWTQNAVYSLGLVLTVPDADHFTVSLETLPGKDATVTHCGFSANAAQCVIHGSKKVDTRHTTRFYLPGYTDGIATDADIPKQTPDMDATRYLTAVIASTAWPVYEVGDLGQYKGAILQQETTTFELADALDTVTP